MSNIRMFKWTFAQKKNLRLFLYQFFLVNLLSFFYFFHRIFTIFIWICVYLFTNCLIICFFSIWIVYRAIFIFIFRFSIFKSINDNSTMDLHMCKNQVIVSWRCKYCIFFCVIHFTLQLIVEKQISNHIINIFGLKDYFLSIKWVQLNCLLCGTCTASSIFTYT